MERTTPHSDRGALLAIAGLGLVLLLVAMDQTIVGTALPRIAADLNGFSLYSWVTTAYLLTETAVIPIAGKLGDLYGRKWRPRHGGFTDPGSHDDRCPIYHDGGRIFLFSEQIIAMRALYPVA